MNRPQVDLMELPDFAQVPVSREEFLFWAEHFIGLPYEEKGTFIEWRNGYPQGHCHCYGLPFAVAQQVGLLEHGPAFWKAFNRSVARFGEAQTLRAYMGAQLKRERKTERKFGDILVFRWNEESEMFQNEADRLRRGRHHVAIDAGDGWVIHALDQRANDGGSVIQSQPTAHDWTQLHQVWSLPQYALKEEAQHSNG